MQPTTILLTGATGLLGRQVLRECRQVAGWQVTGTAWRRTGPGLERVDLADIGGLSTFLGRVNPRLIIHAAAERRPDVSENDPEGTRRLNVGTTAALADWARRHDACLIYLSTDYVFDGRHAPYRPDAPTHALNAYGQSKLDGEHAILSSGCCASVLRVPILYGPCETLDESAVTILAQNMLASRAGESPLKMEHWATRYPTLTDDVALVLRQMAARQIETGDLRGIYHWSGNEPMTKYDMAVAMAPHLGFDPARLVPDASPPSGAPRPKDCHLDTTDLEQLGIGQATPFAAAIGRVLAPHLSPAEAK